MPQIQAVRATGDTSGTADRTNIQRVLDAGNSVALSGAYTLDETLTLSTDYQSIIGTGNLTKLSVAAGFTGAAIKCDGVKEILLSNFYIDNPPRGIELDGVTFSLLHNVKSRLTSTDYGVYLHNGCWEIAFYGCVISWAKTDGIHCAGDGGGANNISITDCHFTANRAHSLRFKGSQLYVRGSSFQASTYAPIALDTGVRSATINGNYFEGNKVAEAIELNADSAAGFIDNVTFTNNYVNSTEDIPIIKAAGGESVIERIVFDDTNRIRGVTAHWLDLNNQASKCRIFVPSRSRVTNVSEDDNVVHYDSQRKTVTETFEVDCSNNGSDQTVELLTLPAGSIKHSIAADVITTFNGDTTTTFDVGDGTTSDAYIATADLGAAGAVTAGEDSVDTTVEIMQAATTITVTFTNTASATAGKVDVHVTYTAANANKAAVAP